MLLRNAALMVCGHVHCLMGLFSAMAFTQIVILKMLVKSNVVIRTSSLADMETPHALMVPNAVMMVSGHALTRMVPTLAVALSHQRLPLHARLNVVRHRTSPAKQTVLSVFNAVMMVRGPVGILMGIINAVLHGLGGHSAHSAHRLLSAVTQRRSPPIMAILFALKAMHVVL
jgi:hypothetical protein